MYYLVLYNKADDDVTLYKSESLSHLVELTQDYEFELTNIDIERRAAMIDDYPPDDFELVGVVGVK